MAGSGQNESSAGHSMSEVSHGQGNLERPSANGCTNGAESRPIPDQFQSTKRAQSASSEHNQSTISGSLPVDLQLVVGAWERLPEALKAGIVAMVKASVKHG